MATQILRTVDRWRFEAPMAVLLAGAAGFAVIAMPRDLFGQVPVAGSLGRPGQAAVALIAALVCGIVAYVAMRRPARRVPIEPDDEDLDVFPEPAPAIVPATMLVAAPADGPIRLRRADRHPDAPARQPIRASRDLGEPFMDIAPLEAIARGQPFVATPEPIEAEHADAEAAEQNPDEIEQPLEERAAQHVETPPSAAPVAPDHLDQIGDVAAPASLVPEPIAASPAATAVAAVPVVEMPVRIPPRLAAATAGRREDVSLSAMIDRLSDGIRGRSDAAVRTIEPPRDRSPALRDALDELNRLAARRG